MVGTQLCVGVIGMYHSGIGGGGFMIVRDSDGNYETIDYREAAPAAAFQDMYEDNVDGSIVGGLAVGVPGDLRGLHYMHDKYGVSALVCGHHDALGHKLTSISRSCPGGPSSTRRCMSHGMASRVRESQEEERGAKHTLLRHDNSHRGYGPLHGIWCGQGRVLPPGGSVMGGGFCAKWSVYREFVLYGPRC